MNLIEGIVLLIVACVAVAALFVVSKRDDDHSEMSDSETSDSETGDSD